MAEVVIDYVNVRFPGSTPAGLFNCSLHVNDRETIAILGSSGSGKTTLLRVIAGLQPHSTGQVRIGGRNVTPLPPAQRDVGLLSQRPMLYPHLSVRRNLAIGLQMRQDLGSEKPMSTSASDRRV